MDLEKIINMHEESLNIPDVDEDGMPNVDPEILRQAEKEA